MIRIVSALVLACAIPHAGPLTAQVDTIIDSRRGPPFQRPRHLEWWLQGTKVWRDTERDSVRRLVDLAEADWLANEPAEYDFSIAFGNAWSVSPTRRYTRRRGLEGMTQVPRSGASPVDSFATPASLFAEVRDALANDEPVLLLVVDRRTRVPLYAARDKWRSTDAWAEVRLFNLRVRRRRRYWPRFESGRRSAPCPVRTVAPRLGSP